MIWLSKPVRQDQLLGTAAEEKYTGRCWSRLDLISERCLFGGISGEIVAE